MLLDKNKKIVFSYIVGPEKPIIKAGEVVSISGRVENVERPVKYIKVNIGNKLDLLMRS
jgi:DNA/RNA endonuclease YhcR with UshA esterase domain